MKKKKHSMKKKKQSMKKKIAYVKIIITHPSYKGEIDPNQSPHSNFGRFLEI
jgi:hypothetical protein